MGLEGWDRGGARTCRERWKVPAGVHWRGWAGATREARVLLWAPASSWGAVGSAWRSGCLFDSKHSKHLLCTAPVLGMTKMTLPSKEVQAG